MAKTRFTFIFLAIFFSLTLPPPYSAQPPPSAAACKSTPYPKLCRSIHSAFRRSPSNYSGGFVNFSVKQCLKSARKLSESIGEFVAGSSKQKLLMSSPEIGALEDCRQLQELSADYLELIAGELRSAAGNLSEAMVCRVQSLLSAVVTNQQTCYDGLAEAASGIAAALAAPLGDAAAMYRVSLGLVTHALSRRRGRGRRGGGGAVSGRRGAVELDWARFPTSDLFEVIILN